MIDAYLRELLNEVFSETPSSITDYSVGQSIPARPPFDGAGALVWSLFTEDISSQPVHNEDEVIIIIPTKVHMDFFAWKRVEK